MSEPYITVLLSTVKNVEARFNLTKVEGRVYEVVYGFSQDGASFYWGSQDYLAQWANCSRESVSRALATLLKMGLLEKETCIVEGGQRTGYKAVLDLSSVVSKSVMKNHIDVTESHIQCDEKSQADVTESHIQCDEKSHIYKRIENSYKKSYSGAAPAQKPDVPEDPSEYIEACRKAARGEEAEDADNL